jgi:hypothetical protein
VVPEQGQPVGFVPAFSFGQGQEDLALFTAAVLRQVPVHGGFGAFIGQVLAPPLNVRRRWLDRYGLGRLGIGLGVLRH